MPGPLRHAPAGVLLTALLLSGGSAHAGAMTIPVMGGSLVANPNPFSFDAGPLGTIYVTGAASGFASWQSNPVPGDRDARADFDNGQIFVQKTDGWFQFYADAGAYSLPSLGTAFSSIGTTTSDTFGALPQAFLKIAPTANFSIQAGKLAAIVGDENPFTFQNFNIERGLLWNQTPLFTRGVQANYTTGPLTLQLSWNDGYYSERFNWLTWQASYSLNDGIDSFSFNGGANLGRTGTS
ncbi:MAG TPA: outer membrane beta-barrel protein, partial [Rhizomicrobium sp.]